MVDKSYRNPANKSSNRWRAGNHQCTARDILMIICADDYGLRGDVDRAILTLADSGKLSAVSCIVALERCTAAIMSALRAHQSALDLGLHLCLTDEGVPLSQPALAHQVTGPNPPFRLLLQRSLLGQIERGEMILQIKAQYDLFVEKCGRRPDFIDGHLHVHQFPGIRTALVEFVRTLPEGGRPYVRNTHLPLRRLWIRRLPWIKSGCLGLFGGAMLKQLKAAGIATNHGFAGIYDFDQYARFKDYLPRFISCLPEPNGMLVTHPGAEEEWRRHEFEALRECAFPTGSPHRFLS